MMFVSMQIDYKSEVLKVYPHAGVACSMVRRVMDVYCIENYETGEELSDKMICVEDAWTDAYNNLTKNKNHE